MSILKTIKTNWRDLVVALVVVFGVALLADMIERMTIMDADTVWLANVAEVLRGLAAFAAANLAAWVMLATAWPTLNHYSNIEFRYAWRGLPQAYRCLAFIFAMSVELLAAAICFSG